MKFKDTVHDLDSSKDTWELLYCKIYREFFSSIFNFEELDDSETSAKCKRWYIKIDENKQPELKKKYPKFKVAGDCDFNFNDKKVRLFEKFLLKEDMELLKVCHDNHHELWNFSFMPITGAMNNTKGCLRSIAAEIKDAVSYDRPDVLIYELDNYYKNLPTRIFSKYNKEALEWYLGNFSDVYEYCKEIYFIEDKGFVDELITSGQKPINSRETVLEYINLANRFWDNKKEKLKKYGII